MRIGLDASPAELALTLKKFPGMRFCRVFGPVGKGIPAWTAPTMTGLIKAGVTPWPSFKDAPATYLPAWLDAMPASVPEVWLTWYHEPETDMSGRVFRQGWQSVSNLVRKHRNGSRVKLVPIHTLYPARHKLWDRFSTDWTKWVGVWQQWAPMGSDGRYLGDYMGWDCYQEVTATAYEDPGVFFRAPIGAAHSVGVPLVIPELGAVRIPTDTTGEGRAAWITACLAHLDHYGTEAVAWWQSTGTNGRDYRLTDDPSEAAWRQAITRYSF